MQETSVLHKSSTDCILKTIGLLLFFGYILFTYIENEAFNLSLGLTSIFLYSFVGYSFIYILIKRNFILERFSSWLIIFTLISFLTLSYSPEPLSFSNSQLYVIIVNTIIILCLSQYKFNFNELKILAWSYLLSGVTLVILIINSGILINLEGRLGNDLFGNANILAINVMTSIMFALWLLMYGKNAFIQNFIIVVSIALMYYGIFMSGGRKYVITPIIFLYIMMLCKRDSNDRRHIMRNTIIIAILIVILYYIIMRIPTVYNVLGQRMEGLFALITGGGEIDASSEIRSNYVKIGLSKWIESPLWGYGTNSFKYYNRIMTGDFCYSHNNYVELLYNYGLIGFLFFYSLYYRLYKTIWKQRFVLPQSVVGYTLALIPSLMILEIGIVSYVVQPILLMLYFSHAQIYATNNSNYMRHASLNTAQQI